MILNTSHAEKVSKLRVDAYLHRYGDRAVSKKLLWNNNDERYLNIGLIDSAHELLSTLRIALLRTAGDFKSVMLMPHDPARCELPVIVLGRGATRQDFESQGFHGVLRSSALKISRGTVATAVMGTMEQGSLRIPQMKELGYTFFENQEPWNGFLKDEKPAAVAILPKGPRLDRAIELLDLRERKRNRPIEDLIAYEGAIAHLHAAIPIDAV